MAIAALLFQRKVVISDSIRVRAEGRYFLFQVSTTGGTISQFFGYQSLPADDLTKGCGRKVIAGKNSLSEF
jgi:hypothetical protein